MVPTTVLNVLSETRLVIVISLRYAWRTSLPLRTTASAHYKPFLQVLKHLCGAMERGCESATVQRGCATVRCDGKVRIHARDLLTILTEL
jgi:hypothetical protein